jgi:hypothetical protein
MYTVLRFRERLEGAERKAVWKSLRESYRQILEENRQPGLTAALQRIFSLKGLYYS